MNKRWINLLGFVSCIGLMAYALYSQYVLLLDPCPLCILQRVAVIGFGIWFLLASLHNCRGWGRWIYAFLFTITTIFGATVAGRHVWLQSLPADQVPACGPGLGYMLDRFPLSKTLDMVFTGSGECANVDWNFLGLSMPTWVLIWIIGLGLVGLFNNLRRA